MASTEALLYDSQRQLRLSLGTIAVLRKQLESAREMVSEARSALESVSHELVGEAKRDALVIERQCQDWQNRDNGINLGEQE